MNTNIFEELPTPAKKAAPEQGGSSQKDAADAPAGGADQQEKMQKRVKQAVYDIRYRARREEIPLDQAYNQYMSNTSMTGPEKAAVKQKLGESYEIDELASSNVASALYKVFVEGVQISNISEDEYLNQLMEMEDKKYKVRVVDKNTGRSYVRYATREKINQLRSNPNIKSVEMTEYGDPYEGERRGGKQTAKTTSGKGLDPVGKEDKDIDNDGDHDKTDKYLLHRRKVRGSAIASRNESFNLSEVKSTSKQNKKKITGEGVDNYKNVVKLFPDDGEGKTDRFGISPSMSIKSDYEMSGAFIAEKAKSKAQQRFMGMVYAAKKGETPASPEVASAAKSISGKEAKKFAKTKHSGLPEKVGEETECNSPEKKKDSRGDYAKVNVIKNKFRAMGARNPIVMVASENVESGYELEGEQLDERRREDKGKPRNDIGKTDLAYRAVKKTIRDMSGGRPAGQRKKDPGKKPPTAGQYGAPQSPAKKVAKRRADAQRAQDNQSSRFD
jgi:hypothetical protein